MVTIRCGGSGTWPGPPLQRDPYNPAAWSGFCRSCRTSQPLNPSGGGFVLVEHTRHKAAPHTHAKIDPRQFPLLSL